MPYQRGMALLLEGKRERNIETLWEVWLYRKPQKDKKHYYSFPEYKDKVMQKAIHKATRTKHSQAQIFGMAERIRKRDKASS